HAIAGARVVGLHQRGSPRDFSRGGGGAGNGRVAAPSRCRIDVGPGRSHEDVLAVVARAIQLVVLVGVSHPYDAAITRRVVRRRRSVIAAGSDDYRALRPRVVDRVLEALAEARIAER